MLALLTSALAAGSVVFVPGVPDEKPVPFSLATKTPYWGKPTTAVDPAGPSETCTPIQVQFAGRHGSRYTDSEDFDDLAAFMKEHGAAITATQFQYLKNYENPFPRDQPDHLTQRGKEELYNQGRRYREKFSSNLLQTYNPDTIKMEHTFASRTGRSAASFFLGAFPNSEGGLGSCGVEPLHTVMRWSGRTEWDANYTESDGDTVLRPDENCARFEFELNDNDNHNANKLPDQFAAQNITDEVVPRVAAKLGWNETVIELTAKHVELFYKACQYDAEVWDNVDGNACDLFTQKDFEMYAFEKDLGEYYEAGKGSEFKDILGCPLFSKMMTDMVGAVDGSSKVKAAFHFGHSDTVMALLSVLGMYHGDEAPTPDMSWEKAQERQWRTDTIAPMGSNVAFHVYKCHEVADGPEPILKPIDKELKAEAVLVDKEKGEEMELIDEEVPTPLPTPVPTPAPTPAPTVVYSYKVEIRHNENHAKWPRCGSATNVDFCSIDNIKAAYPKWNSCKFASDCKLPDGWTPIPVSESGSSVAASILFALVAVCAAML